MSRSNEVYRYERIIKRQLENIRSGNDPNKDVMLRYHEQSVAESLSLARILKRLTTLRYLSELLGMRFEDTTRQDIVGLVAKIEQKDVGMWTKLDYKKVLKRFYKWLRGTDESPPEVRWIRSGSDVPNGLMKKDLLTPEEAKQIAEHTRNIQDKALFSVLFDSGRRLGEILGLRICDVEFDSIGATLRVEGKVGQDRARIVDSTSALRTWIENHPNGKDPDSPLWISFYEGKAGQMSYSAARCKLKRAARRAGVEKRVWLYLFRHSRITNGCTKLSYAEMCHLWGWKQGSRMPMRYVHLAGDDRDAAYLKMNGIQEQDNGHPESAEYVPRVCERCKRNNSPDSKFCNGCGSGLDIKNAKEANQRKENARKSIDALTTELAKSPEVLDVLLNALGTLKNGDRVPNRS